jgi:prevent-host-death family protein
MLTVRGPPAPLTASDHYNDHMVKKMTATEVKSRILALLDDVTGGDEVEITKHGRVVARLIPARGPRSLKGTLAGVAMTAGGDEEALFATGAAWDLPQP